MMKKLLCTLAFLLISIVTIQAQSINVTGQGIIIPGDGTNTPVVTDDTEYGSLDASSGSVTHTFTINNTSADVIVVGLNNLSNQTDFSQSASPSPTVLNPAGTSVFSVTFDPELPAGLKSSVVSVSVLNLTTFTNETYFYNIQGTATVVTAPDINVLGNGAFITNGDATPSSTDDTDFGQVDISAGSVTNTFTILNTGTSDLNLSGNVLVVGSSDFTVTAQPTSPIGPSSSSSFDISYDPSSTGISSATVVIQSDDPDENPFTFTVQGEGTNVVLSPEIDITGNGVSITAGDATPSTTDDTDFGQADITSGSVTNTFTINNTGGADLVLSGNVLVVGSADFTITAQPSSPIAPSGSSTFAITFDPSAVGISTATVVVQSNDADENPYTFTVQGEGTNNVPAPEMDVFGNSNEITDGDVTPSVTDDTEYGQVDVGSGTVQHTFTIQNNGTADLNLTGASPFVVLTGDTADFTLTAIPSSTIGASASTTFIITFDPTSLGVKTATVSMANDDADENPYTFTVQGEGIDVNLGTPLLITQYYEGTGNNQWIEVKNISQGTVIAGEFFLALFTNFNTLSGTINSVTPNQSVVIGTMAPGAVRIFRNPSASLPSAGNLGSGASTSTAVCTFDGNDVILISTSNGTNSYNDRIDIVGVVDAVTPRLWGQDISFIKGCGTNESPSTTFDATVTGGTVTVNDYIELTLTEVDNANPLTNIALGTQGIGTTTWTSSWNNEVPDRTRNTVVSGTYTAGNGSFESCNLTVSGNLNFNSGTTNFVDVHGDLSITGTFTVGDTESLYFDIDHEDATISGAITKIENSTSLVNNEDFTYWSSPVTGATISSVFSNANLSRVFYWDQSADDDGPGGDVGDPTITLGRWFNATGTMIRAKGYISEGPTAGAYPQQHSVSFTGTPNNGVISISGTPHMVFNNDGNAYSDYNLIGNPYPSAIDADVFIGLVDNNAIDGTVYLWTHNTQNNGNATYQYTTDDYASYNLTGGTAAATGGVVPNGNIASGQGFMVRAISPSPGVVFNNAMRLRDANNQFFRPNGDDPIVKNGSTDVKDRIWLDVESSEGGAFNQILIGFFENATDGYDRGYDGLKNGASWVNFYSKIDTLGYAIQGLSSFSVEKQISLGFDTYISDPLTYTISIANIEGVLNDNDVYLVDNLLNVTHDLKLADYQFDVDGVGYFSDRFVLQFTKSVLGTDDLSLDNNFVVSNDENRLQVRSNSVVTNIKVYDIRGRLLIDKDPNDNQFDINTSAIRKGTVLILNATFENGAEVSKKAIKY